MAFTGNISATVLNGKTLSGSIDLTGNVPVGILLPDALTSTTMTFNRSDDGFKWVPVYTSSAQLSITVAAGRYVGLKQDEVSQLRGIKFLQLVCGSTEAPTASSRS